MLQTLISQNKSKMQQALVAFVDELKNIRTGQADTSLVANISVAYYGTLTPLKNMANITTSQGNLIVIQPWDKNNLGDIELAIRNSNLGLSPVNDGRQIRIPLPPMTGERREEYLKMIKQKAEATRIALRSIREETWKEIKTQEKDGRLSEDERFRGGEELNRLIKEMDDKIAEMVRTKEKEIKTV